jgi:hypothetical protein
VEELLKKIPLWVIAVVLLVFVGIFIERTYFAKQSFYLFGQRFGPDQIKMIDERVTKFSPNSDAISKKPREESHKVKGESGAIPLMSTGWRGTAISNQKCKDLALKAMEGMNFFNIKNGSFSVFGQFEGNEYTLICLSERNRIVTVGAGKDLDIVSNMQQKLGEAYAKAEMALPSDAYDSVNHTPMSVSSATTRLNHEQCKETVRGILQKMGIFVPPSKSAVVFGERREYNFAIVFNTEVGQATIFVDGPDSTGTNDYANRIADLISAN